MAIHLVLLVDTVADRFCVDVFEQNKTDKLITLVGSNFLVFNNGVSLLVHFSR